MGSQVYIVRVWSEPNPSGPSVWRVSIMDAISQERWFFSSPASLCAFLSEHHDGTLDGVWFTLEQFGNS